MSDENFEIGALVKLRSAGQEEMVGIVSQPISDQHPGHVLSHVDGCILGHDASISEVEPVGETAGGFAQLGYLLIKLGSHVIENKLLVYHS